MLFRSVGAQVHPAMGEQTMSPQMTSPTLPPLPENLPAWMRGKKKNHIFYKKGPYNFDIYNIKPLAYDLNAVAVGHAMAYEDMVTGKASTLDTQTFDRINWVLNHPPRLMRGDGETGVFQLHRAGSGGQSFLSEIPWQSRAK